ncbi:MAG: tetratricopeptide repeat protein [bacterium]|nr:tetratricopeptide repeat protein [Candidatus Sumerlaeota bacterium]
MAAQILIFRAFRQYQAEVDVYRSDELRAKQQHAQARQLAWEASRNDPYNGYAYYFSGTSEFYLDQYQQAIQTFREAEKYMPHLPNVLRQVGQCHYFMNEFEAASSVLERYFLMDPVPQVGPDVMFRYRAQALYFALKFGEAAVALARADDYDNFRMEILQSRLANTLMLNQITMADYLRRRFRFCFQGRPEHIDAPMLLAAAMAGGKLQILLRFLEVSWMRGDADSGTLKALGLGYVRSNRTDEAIAVFQQAYRLDANDTEVPLFLGDVYMKRGDAKTAEDWYRRHLRLSPESPYRDDIGKKLGKEF